MPKAVTIISGGLDSAVLAYYLRSLGYEQKFLTFNYGQRHVKEVNYAEKLAAGLDSHWHLVDLSNLAHHLSGSALTQKNIEVPEGHYTADNMAITVVPNRNAIMLSIAWGVACADRADMVAFAAHAGDHAIYPDCRQNFVAALSNALSQGTVGSRALSLYIAAPFVDKTKAEIVKMGAQLEVPFQDTWSCYKGEEVACGRCGTCVERLEAFNANALIDPISYRDREYWLKTVMTNEKSGGEQ